MLKPEYKIYLVIFFPFFNVYQSDCFLMNRFNSVVAFGAAASTLLLTTGVNAQSNTDVQSDSSQKSAEVANDPLLKITVTGTRNEEKVLDYPGSVNVFTRRDLIENPITNIRQLFNEIPGVTTFEGTRQGVRGMPGVNNINIRGMEGDRNLFVIDGIRLPDRYEYGGYYEIGRTQYVDFNFLSSIEVLKGANSALWGPDALGGVVSYRSLIPSDILDVGEDFAVELSSNLSSNSRTNSVIKPESNTNIIVANQLSPSLSTVLSYTYEKSGATITRAEPGYQNEADNYGNNYYANIQYDFNDDSRINLAFEDINRSSNVKDSAKNLPDNYSKLDSYTDTTRTRVSLEYNYDNPVELNTFISDANIIAYWQETRVDDDYTRETLPTRSRGRVTPGKSEYRDHNLTTDGYGVNAKFNSNFDLFNTNHLLTWGIDYSYLDASRTRTIQNLVDGLSSQEKETPNSTVTRFGVYLEDSFSVGDFDLVGALRFDNYKLDATNDDIYIESSNGRTDFAGDYDHSSVTPKVSLTYNINDDSIIYATYSRGFRPGAWYEINTSYDNLYCPIVSICGVTTESNPDLEPETSNNYEIGFKADGQDYDITLAGYYNTYNDFIESLVDINKRDSRGYAISKTINIGKASIAGVELAARYFFGEQKTGFNVRNSLSYSEGADLENNEPLESVIPFSNWFSIGYLDRDDIWSVELGMRYVASPRVSSTYSNFIPPSAVTFDALSYWNVTDKLIVTLGIYNILNYRNYNFQDVRAISATDDTITRFSQPARSVAGSFTWKF